MAEQQAEPKKEIERYEKRNFKYINEVEFEFDIDVSNPDNALVEIADFIELMSKATEDLRELQKTFASKIEKPVKENAGGGSNAGKVEGQEPIKK